MVYLLAGLIAIAAGLSVLAVAELVAARPRAVQRQLQGVAQLSRGEPLSPHRATVAPARLVITRTLVRLGAAMRPRSREALPVRELLGQAGFRRPEAMAVFLGARTVATLVVPPALAAAWWMARGGPGGALLVLAWSAAAGWLAPKLYLRLRASARRREIERNLPDALDLLVVCVEAGLGINQAIARMSDEIRHFSPATGEEFSLVNLELRAGVPRADAMRNLGTRMGVAELRSLSTMLVQADRFGTSIGQALRVHADTARQKRQQRAEEAAAKTSVKLIFPLVLCIFPTIFVVILGPAVINIIRTLSGL